MGQAKERKARLGKWYGHPIGPGHPDFVPPKKPEPIRPLLRFDMIAGCSFDGCSKMHATKIDRFDVYGKRIEVKFVEGDSYPFWPVLEGGKAQGKLTIGSREFGDVEFVRYTETGCVFIRSQAVQEETSKSEPIEGPSCERSIQEEPNMPPQRAVGTMPNRRRVSFIFSALAVAAIGMNSIPEPEYQPKKR